MNYLSTAGLVAGMLISPFASAEKLFSDSSISLLYSDQYQAFGGEERTDTYVTFENVTAHDWGGTFLFVDRNQGRGRADGDDDLYGEFSPALSLGWLSGGVYLKTYRWRALTNLAAAPMPPIS
ncbi:hypothetical protein [Vreelandella maris]|uniref:hypothetical protein n=1 Tax=Vreelandella maris TaxID=2729617 RepID=UPI0030EB4B2E